MKKTSRIFLLILVAFFLIIIPSFATTNEKQSTEARDLLETARTYMKAGKYMKAIYQYDLLLDKHKDSEQEASWGLYEKAFCYYKMKKYSIAIKGFESVKRQYPEAYGPITLAEKMISQIEKRKDK